MAVRTFNLHSLETYSLKSDTVEPRTAFQLGPIDAPLMAALEDELMLYKKEHIFRDGDTGVVLRLNQRYVEFVRFGVKGWEHLQDSTGKAVQFATQEYSVDRVGLRTGVKDELLKSFSLEDIAELAQRIQRLNKLSEDQEKN